MGIYKEDKMKVCMLYSRTNLMAQPWLDAGHEVIMFDGQHEGITKEGNLTKVGMWFDAYKTDKHVRDIIEICGSGVDLVIGFPECTDLAVSGAAHFAKKSANNIAFQAEAVELARLVKYVGDYYGCPWMLENPVSVMATIWRKADFSFHPYEYGGYLPEDDIHPDYPEYIKPRDAYPKKTCIWHGNGFIEPERDPVYVESGYSDQHKKLGGKSLKTKNIRSATPRGFAMAVFLANEKR